MVAKKLRDDLALHRVIEVPEPKPPFISAPLGLVPKHNGVFPRIHYLSQLTIIFLIERGSCNTPSFRRCWTSICKLEDTVGSRKETGSRLSNHPGYLPTSMAGFGLQHYLNNFIAIFPAVEIPPERMNYEAKAYIWLTDIHGIPRNDSKDQMGTELSVFGIKVNTSIFTARLPKDKLERAIKSTAEVLANSSVSLLDLQLLVGFLSFCSQAVKLGRVFMKRLRGFVNQFS